MPATRFMRNRVMPSPYSSMYPMLYVPFYYWYACSAFAVAEASLCFVGVSHPFNSCGSWYVFVGLWEDGSSLRVFGVSVHGVFCYSFSW